MALLAVLTGCREQAQPSAAASSSAAAPAALPPATLPDVSRAAAPVQTQLREAYAAMTATVGRPGAAAMERAAAYGDMGKLFIAAEFFDAAARCFDHAEALAPNDMRWPYYRGHLARLLNDPASAASAFQRALAIAPQHVPSLIWLAEMQMAQGRPDKAKPLLLEAQALAPREPAVLYGLGRLALESRDYAEAVKDLEAALALYPSATRVQYPLAMAYRGLGDAAQAEAHLRLRGEVDLPPADALIGDLGGLLKNAAAFETRGTEAIDARKWPEAIAHLRQAIAVSPNNGFTRLNLGTALYMTGDARGALEQFQTAVRLRPDLAKAHYAIGVLKDAAGDDAAAIEAFTTAVQADPAYAEARLSLGDALRRSGRIEPALAEYRVVLDANPSASQASFGYAMGLVRLRRYGEARDRLDEAARTYPDQPGFAHALARLLAAAPDDAVRDGRRALALMSDLLKTQNTLGTAETMAMTFAELGRWTEAIDWQRQTLDAARQLKQPAVAGRLAANLRRYEAHQPCRVPWADDDPVHRPGPARSQ
jgi:tetratricopeptide (TPR) repeat protein